MGRRHFIIAFFVLAVFTPLKYVSGQQLIVKGQFLVDSIKIGLVFPYSLSLYHPEHVDVLFPDSTYSFAPFEFDHKRFFSTKTSDGISYDSAVYFLSSFEIDSVQKLGLPVFVAHAGDCTAVYAKKDSVLLTFLVDRVPEATTAKQLPLKVNTTYRVVRYFLNYPFFIALGGGIIILLLVLWIVFRRRIRRYFLLRKLNKKHILFLHRFDDLVQQIMAHGAKEKLEKILTVWKQYLEGLLDKPFTTYTSKEIFELVRDKPLYGVLQKMDYGIHGAAMHEKIEEKVFLDLKYFAEDSFAKKIIEIKHA